MKRTPAAGVRSDEWRRTLRDATNRLCCTGSTSLFSAVLQGFRRKTRRALKPGTPRRTIRACPTQRSDHFTAVTRLRVMSENTIDAVEVKQPADDSS